MANRIKLFGFPEILLWLVIPVAFYFGDMIIGLFMIVSWGLHIRLRRDSQFPNFGSLFQVFFSITGCLGWVYTSGLLTPRKTPQPDDLAGVLQGLAQALSDMPYAMLAYLFGCIFLGAQVFF